LSIYFSYTVAIHWKKKNRWKILTINILRILINLLIEILAAQFHQLMCYLFTISFNVKLNRVIGLQFFHNNIVSPIYYLPIYKNKKKYIILKISDKNYTILENLSTDKDKFLYPILWLKDKFQIKQAVSLKGRERRHRLLSFPQNLIWKSLFETLINLVTQKNYFINYITNSLSVQCEKFNIWIFLLFL